MQKDTIIGVEPVVISLRDYERSYSVLNTAGRFREDPMASLLLVPAADENREELIF